MTAPQSADQGRIEAIDALRGFALVGIYLINITSMGGPIDMEQPAGAPSLSNIDWAVWFTSHTFVYGAMRGLFSLLFGASALLFLGEAKRDSATFLRRSWWLFWFGVINATLLLWPGDILMIYALASPVILIFRRASVLRLLIAAGAIILLLSAWSFVDAAFPLGADEDAGAAEFAQEQQARLGGYFANLAFLASTSLGWTLDVHTGWWVFDAAAFMLIGMALFRAAIITGAAKLRTYAILGLLGFGLGLPLRAWAASTALANDGDFSPLAQASFQIGRLAVTLGWVGAFMLAWRTTARLLFAPFSALGRMAFTNYLAQSAIAACLFSGFGLGLWNQLSWLQMWALVPVVMLGLALFSMAWLSAFRMGPLEWLWRRLTFGGAAALRRRLARS